MKRLAIVLLALASPASAQEPGLLATLRSAAPTQAKIDACRELARVGTKRAVPVLAPLLLDETLSHMARYALEPIADPSVDAALRGALSRTRGRALAGIIASVGARKDAMAAGPLAKCLTDPDPMVAAAAARALGSIGAAGAPALRRALSSGPVTNRSAVSEGLLRGAESVTGAGAAAIYDLVRAQRGLPRHVQTAALWGAIRSRGLGGAPLLLQTIRSGSYEAAAGAIRLSTSIPGADLTRALAGEAARAGREKQLLLVQTLGDRRDSAASPALGPLARRGSPEVRIAAIRALVQLGSPSSLGALIASARDADAGVAGAARAGLVAFRGKEVDGAVAVALNGPDRGVRTALAEVAVRRRIKAAVPAMLRAARDADPAMADAGYKALGALGGVADLAAIVAAMRGSKDVAAAEEALSAICARQPDPTVCAAKLVPGLAKAQGEPKLALLRVLGAVGGPQALAAVRAAASGPDPSVSETARRALCEWPTADALPDLARIARTSTDPTTRILAVRGQLRLIPAHKVSDARKLAQLREVLPLLGRKEERSQALTVLAAIPSAESLELVVPYLTGGKSTEEANLAAVAIAEKIVAAHPAEVADALELVQTSDDQLLARIRQVLARAPNGAVEAGFTALFNGRDLSGWEGKPGWWRVEDGALTAESTPAKPCPECNYLMWRGGRPADFELRASFRLSPGANSGIQIRSEERPNWDTFGYQADMTGDGELVGFVYHHSRGLIAGRGERATFAADGSKTVEKLGVPEELLAHFRPGQWNAYRVVCRGPEITLYVNGVLMCQITDHHATQAAKSGIIALQMHPGPPMKIQFRNIRIKEPGGPKP